MGTLYEQQANLGDFLEYQRQLQDLLIASSGTKVSAWGNNAPLSARVEKLSSQLAMQVGKGERFDSALDSATDFPLPLRLSWNAWLATDRSPDSFDILQPPVAKIPGRRRTWFLPVQLAILLVLALTILAFWNEIGSRALLAIYRDSDLQPGILVTQFQQWSPYPRWYLIAPIGLLFLGIFIGFRKLQQQGVASWNTRDAVPLEVQKWQEGKFLELLTQHNQSIDVATVQYSRLAQNKIAAPKMPSPNAEASSLNPSWVSAWGAELAFEKRMQFKLSSIPYLAFLFLSGLIVFGVAAVVFGSLIELLYALLPAGAFSR